MAENRFAKYSTDTEQPTDNRFAKYAAKKPSTVDELKRGALNAAYGLTTGLSDPVYGAAQLPLNAVNDLYNTTSKAFRGVSPDNATGPGVKRPDTFLQGVTDDYNNWLSDNEKMYQQATPGSIPAGTGRFIGNLASTAKLIPNPGKMGPLATAVNGAKTGAVMAATAPVYTNSGEDYWAKKAQQEAIAMGAGAGMPFLGKLLGQGYGAIEPMLPWATKKVVANNILRNTTQDTQVGGVAPVDKGFVGNTVEAIKQGLTGKAPEVVPVQTPAQMNVAALNGPRSVAEVQARIKKYLDNPFVPGSKLTTAQVINTDAAARGEKALMNGQFSEQFGSQANDNNAARIAALSRLARTPEELAAAVKARADATKPMYDAAFAQNYPITPDLQKLLETPNAKPAIERGMRLLSNRMKDESGITAEKPPSGLLDANGVPFDIQGTPGTISGRMLQALKLGLQAQYQEGTQTGMAKLDQEALQGQQGTLHGWLKGNAPKYLEADNKFRELSQPVNEMAIGQGIQNKLGIVEDPEELIADYTKLGNRKQTTTSGDTALTLNNFNASLRKVMNGPDGEYGVTPEGSKALDAIAADLQRAGSGARAVEKTGSDTAYNLQAPGMVSRWLYGPEMEGGTKALPGTLGALGTGLGAIAGPLLGDHMSSIIAGGAAGGAGIKAGAWLGHNTSDRLNAEFAKAMLDPAYYSQLLHEALVREQGGLLGSVGSVVPQASGTSGLLNSF